MEYNGAERKNITNDQINYTATAQKDLHRSLLEDKKWCFKQTNKKDNFD